MPRPPALVYGSGPSAEPAWAVDASVWLSHGQPTVTPPCPPRRRAPHAILRPRVPCHPEPEGGRIRPAIRNGMVLRRRRVVAPLKMTAGTPPRANGWTGALIRSGV